MIGTRTDLDPIVTVRWPFAEHPLSPAAVQVSPVIATAAPAARLTPPPPDTKPTSELARSPTIWKGQMGSTLPQTSPLALLTRRPPATAAAAATAAVPDLGPLAASQHRQVSLVDRAGVSIAGSAVDGAVPLAVNGVQTVGTLVPPEIRSLPLAPLMRSLRADAVELVAAPAAGKPILALGPLEPVVSDAAVDPIVAGPGVDPVGLVGAYDLVGAAGSDNPLRERGPSRKRDKRREGADRHEPPKETSSYPAQSWISLDSFPASLLDVCPALSALSLLIGVSPHAIH